MPWNPSLGAIPVDGATRFRVWATTAHRLEVAVETGPAAGYHRLTLEDNGYHSGTIDGVLPGDRYRYRIDGGESYPDPASRHQPLGVHGPSEVIDASRYEWRARDWTGHHLKDLIFYELHIGTFTPEGTFAAAAERLPYLRELGITAIELMPVADFPGERNWGYDPAALYAPARCYGTPDDLRALVDAAHTHGIAVYLDVVYNHFGPDGAYAATFSPRFYTRRHRSPWGKGINFDGPGSREVRRFFVENALHWIHEFRFDGLRLDATPMITDDSPRHIVAEIAESVRSSIGGERHVHLIAEDYRNLADIVKPVTDGGWDMDAVWSDDFHHAMRRRLAGDSEAYYSAFSGSAVDIARTILQGWFYTGQETSYYGGPRGTDPSGLPPEKFVFYIQNHDMVGNRAFGDRLHHNISLPKYRAAIALLLLAPQTPLLFMGQEWAASTPFLFFTDHHGELGKRVRRGRREEFRKFRAFSDKKTRSSIPDPQALETFTSSKLRWEETEKQPHWEQYQLCRDLLRVRKQLYAGEAPCPDIKPVDNSAIVISRSSDFVAVIVLQAPCVVDLGGHVSPEWRVALNTGGGRLVGDHVEFRQPGAILLQVPGN